MLSLTQPHFIIRLSLTLAAALILNSPASALDLNAFRAQHRLPPLAMSSALAALAYEQAHSMATRTRLDHANFHARVTGLGGGMHAENVAMIACARPDAKPVSTFAGRACGCATEDCAIRLWSRSGGHRRNMLRRDVSAYGIASATGANGRVYWALELGN